MIQRASVSFSNIDPHHTPTPGESPSAGLATPTLDTTESLCPLRSSLHALAARYRAVESAAADLNTASDTIALISQHLVSLASLVAQPTNGSRTPRAESHRSIDRIVESIHTAAAHFPRVRTLGFQVQVPNFDVVEAVQGRADSPNPPIFDVYVEVQTPTGSGDQPGDVAGLINGRDAVGEGRTLSLSNADCAFTITLTDHAARNTGIHYAFRLNAVHHPPHRNGSFCSPAPIKPASEALADARTALRTATTVAENARRPDPDPRSIESAVTHLAEARAEIDHTIAGAIEIAHTHIEHDFQDILTRHSPDEIRALFITGTQPQALSPAAVLPLIRG